MKVITIRDCFECPLSAITGETKQTLKCFSASIEIKEVNNIIGSVGEVMKNNIIPDWCPLTSIEDFMKAYKTYF